MNINSKHSDKVWLSLNQKTGNRVFLWNNVLALFQRNDFQLLAECLACTRIMSNEGWQPRRLKYTTSLFATLCSNIVVLKSEINCEWETGFMLQIFIESGQQLNKVSIQCSAFPSISLPFSFSFLLYRCFMRGCQIRHNSPSY